MGKVQVNNKYSAPIPAGVIVDWYGAASAVPMGWALCDGQSGTPDLRDRFVVGAGSAYILGAQGGEAVHTLTASEMPRHNHSFSAITSGGTAIYDGGTYGRNAPFSTGYAGDSQPHNNLPPYFALFKIMKL